MIYEDKILNRSLVMGLCGLIGFIIITVIILLPISLISKIIALLGSGTFFFFAWSYYSYEKWEDITRRRTANTLLSLGSFLILKGVTSISLISLKNVEIVANYFSYKDGQETQVGAVVNQLFFSDPTYINILLIFFGFLMLISVRLFTKESQQYVNNLDMPVKNNFNNTHIPKYHTYDSDLPPYIDVWVGRDSELLLLEEISNGVIAITGIGGQGKSVLAAKALKMHLKNNRKLFWDWRDCREQAERFRTHLICIIEHLSEGKISIETIGKANISWLSHYFFREFGDREGLIVFDNVDSYVNVDDSIFTTDISLFVDEALRVNHNFTFIITCRPRISYPSARFRELYLRGLSFNETKDLFRQRISKGVLVKIESSISEIHKLTNGHPLWLTIIASQILRKPDTIDVILEQLRTGETDDRAVALLRGIWKTLTSNQKYILRCMAELPRALESDLIYEYLMGSVGNHNRFYNAFNGLKAISLIIEKRSDRQPVSQYELHPLVRTFIRKEFSSKVERNDFIDAMIECCDRLIKNFGGDETKLVSVQLLEQLTTKVELAINKGDIDVAIVTLSEATNRLITKGLHEEVIRLGILIVDKTDWGTSAWCQTQDFCELIGDLIKILTELGREDIAREYLISYEKVIQQGTASFIGLCEYWAYVEWFLGDYKEAIKWASQGKKIKNDSGIDTKYDTGHTLALALRDSGSVDEALEYFRHGENMDEILIDDHKNSIRGASFYGNIGRCLFLQGKIQQSIICYAKSYDILQGEVDSTTKLNLGYAALWIGELLMVEKDYEKANYFLNMSRQMWEIRSPKQAEKPIERLKELKDKCPDLQELDDTSDIEDYCQNWTRQEIEKK